MRKLLVILTFFIGIAAQSQEAAESPKYDKTATMYKTYADFQAKKGVPAGQYFSFSWSSWGKNTLHTYVNGKEQKFDINDYWGFTVGDFLFRSRQNQIRIPVVVLNIKNSKVFYCEGYMFLDMIRADATSGRSSRTDDSIFYSDDMEGDIYEITKLPKKEKGNPELAGMIECVKKGEKRRGYQAQFNSFYECITTD